MGDGIHQLALHEAYLSSVGEYIFANLKLGICTNLSSLGIWVFVKSGHFVPISVMHVIRGL
jgi:hypothetical protein